MVWANTELGLTQDHNISAADQCKCSGRCGPSKPFSCRFKTCVTFLDFGMHPPKGWGLCAVSSCRIDDEPETLSIHTFYKKFRSSCEPRATPEFLDSQSTSSGDCGESADQFFLDRARLSAELMLFISWKLIDASVLSVQLSFIDESTDPTAAIIHSVWRISSAASRGDIQNHPQVPP